MSGPIPTKGVLILRAIERVFGHLAPLALNASIVFERSTAASRATSAPRRLYALLSSLSGLALRQDIAVTGALNQHGEVPPVGGPNEKIEAGIASARRPA